ncbi:MAG: HAD family phosphatase [Thermoanaerobaculia bacterium]|nr:HAD family phosphatase [Thermoanaerobaculia bacterium]
MPRAVLFDFNGVLVDDEPIHLRLLLQVLAEEGIEPPAAWARTSFVGVDDRSCLRAALAWARRPYDPVLEARLVARKAAYYQAEIRTGGYPVFPGAAAAVAALADAGLPLGVVSGALRAEVEGALRAAGIRDRFALLVAAEDVAHGKPDPEGYVRALGLLRRSDAAGDRLVHPHEVVAVEDSPAGLAAAAAAGLATLAVIAGPLEGVRPSADAVVGSVAEITPALLAKRFD